MELTGEDRARGALLGLACGDAVGTTVEFRRPGSFEPLTDLVGGGPFGLPAGAWTDDTSMALCLAESLLDTALLDTGQHDLGDQLRRYLMWSDDGYLSSTGSCFDIGGTTRRQLERFRRTGVAVDPVVDQESAANGSLMRLAPVPIRWSADVALAAQRSGESSRTTHAAERPVDACRLYGAMIAAVIGGEPLESVLAPGFFVWGDLHPQVAAIADGSYRAKEPPQIRGTGFCVDALEAALWAVAGATDFKDAVLRAANLGDDADTTAAIAGQLAGAHWGASGIPVEWLDRLVLRERIDELARGLHRAARATAPAPPPVGRPSWPHDHELHAWWVEPGVVLAGEYPGDRDPRRARDQVNLLIDAGVRTFVDLTTPQDRLEPYAALVEQAAAARRLDVQRRSMPIPDLGVIDDAGYDEILAVFDERRSAGAVYVHCWGGIGRTGTVVGLLLGRDGSDVESILGRIAELRSGTKKVGRPSPETSVQVDVLHRAAARI